MKRSLDHLPQSKQKALRAIAKIICAAVDVEMIVLYGSFARGDWVEDAGKNFYSDYDILVIVKNERLAHRHKMWSQLRRQARRFSGKAEVSLIAHSIEDVNQQLARGQYFFSDIKKEGVVLFDAERVALAEEKETTAAERQAYARACFGRGFDRATTFYETFEYLMERGKNDVAAFQLHQAAETFYKTVILVFTAYLPRKTHRLEELSRKCGDLHPVFRDIFPQVTDEDRRRFDLLEAAYLEARYSMSYTVSREDLESLADAVRDLASRTAQVCHERIVSMA